MKLKKLLAIMLVGTTTLSVAACGSSASGTTASSDATEEESADAADSASSGASADAAASSSEALEGDLSDIIPDKTVTLDVYDQLANYSGEQIGWFAKVIKDKFNVKLNIIPDADGVYDTRMESGNLGDLVIWGSDGDKYQQAVDKGML